ncbi:AraC family transcriptional regulator [Paenibacillus sp.]|uniref:helix-turn-helix transcriptional regulator n=1 Tax=Paenibacillus sp. TaxID=58172 RepID=UPI002D6EEB18|nr:AraC family transcriptional regulator [Paenibacillus sp.]HZG86497.1 AraC family transcriptional regulator [Paenibacillus sp.]
MQCLELAYPPMPQLITVGHAVWTPGMTHLRRNFPVYDLIFVRRGTFFICEEGEEHELAEGGFVALEPGRTHWGHRAVEEPTDLYWVHFAHDSPRRAVDRGGIARRRPLERGTDGHLEPVRSHLYVPKRATIPMEPLVPLLDDMVLLHRSLTPRSAILLQARLGELLARLQPEDGDGGGERSRAVCDAVVRYLQERIGEPFDAERMERELHYHFDYLARCLKRHTGLSPLQYLHRLQIEQAKSLLLCTDLPVAAVGERVGQPNPTYFARLFRRFAGAAPSAFRSSHKTLDAPENAF